MLLRSIEAFREFDPECAVVVVLHPDFNNADVRDALVSADDTEIFFATGGDTRIASVRNGLAVANEIAVDAEAKVFIHDAARPLVTPELICRGAETAAPNIGAVPGIEVTDSIRYRTNERRTESVDRSKFVIVQTPQVFMLEDITKAYAAVADDAPLTDDASVAEKAGMEIVVYPGESTNIKVTRPQDFAIAEELLKGLSAKNK